MVIKEFNVSVQNGNTFNVRLTFDKTGKTTRIRTEFTRNIESNEANKGKGT